MRDRSWVRPSCTAKLFCRTVLQIVWPSILFGQCCCRTLTFLRPKRPNINITYRRKVAKFARIYVQEHVKKHEHGRKCMIRTKRKCTPKNVRSPLAVDLPLIILQVGIVFWQLLAGRENRTGCGWILPAYSCCWPGTGFLTLGIPPSSCAWFRGYMIDELLCET